MNEEFLYYIWKARLFNSDCLQTTDGEEIEIIYPGLRNDDSGPDFFNARIRIAGVLWAGNVEIHVKASDWIRHHHQRDVNYDTIVLHVVFDDDKIILRPNGSSIPTLSLKGRVSSFLLNQYLDLVQGGTLWIPCEKSIAIVNTFKKNNWYERVLVERLQKKNEEIGSLLVRNNHDWEEAFYRYLLRAFGFKINNQPFEMLGNSLPMTYLSKHRNELVHIEALLFGQAGFLADSIENSYFDKLKTEYQFFKTKFGLTPLSRSIWKFGRLRPANFPTLRIAQFASIFYHNEKMLSKVLTSANLSEVYSLFHHETSPYWLRHYHFKKQGKCYGKWIGSSGIENLVINAIIPFVFYYGYLNHQPDLKEKALIWFEQCKPETNKITKGWEAIGEENKSGARSQALIHLKEQYCDLKKCLSCSIGQEVINQHVQRP